MEYQIQKAAIAVSQMDEYLKSLIKETSSQRLWKDSYIKQQIEKRNAGGKFSLSDHIRAMVYAMLSSGTPWERIERHLPQIDEIFCQYNSDQLLETSPEQLRDRLKSMRCASQYTMKQMTALITVNIQKLIEFEKQYRSIDAYYQKSKEEDETLKTLIKKLSNPNSKMKMAQMGEALSAEYLRNVGYDIAKPDRHIRRILGSKILACSEKEVVPIAEAFDIVTAIAKVLNKPVAEVDYILWMYCAKGYGEICTVNKPKCNICVAKEHCNSAIEIGGIN